MLGDETKSWKWESLFCIFYLTTLILLAKKFKANSQASLWDLPGTKNFLQKHNLNTNYNTKSSFTFRRQSQGSRQLLHTAVSTLGKYDSTWSIHGHALGGQ